MKRIARLIVVLIVSLTTLQLLAPAASAAVYARDGRTGKSYVYRGACSYMRTNLNGWLRTETAPPAIYARNRRSGYGNDSQLVRYRAFLVDAWTGDTISSTNYTSWARAYDNRPANFLGNTYFDAGWRGNYVIDYRIEWRRGDGTVAGWVAQRHNSYNAYYQNVGPYGPIATCYKYV